MLLSPWYSDREMPRSQRSFAMHRSMRNEDTNGSEQTIVARPLP